MIKNIDLNNLNIPKQIIEKTKSKHIVFSPHISSIQIWTKNKNLLSCSSKIRKGITKMEDTPKILEIASSPRTQHIKESLKNIIKAKIYNDLDVCNALIKSEEFKKIFGNIEEITREEIII